MYMSSYELIEWCAMHVRETRKWYLNSLHGGHIILRILQEYHYELLPAYTYIYIYIEYPKG